MASVVIVVVPRYVVVVIVMADIATGMVVVMASVVVVRRSVGSIKAMWATNIDVNSGATEVEAESVSSLGRFCVEPY